MKKIDTVKQAIQFLRDKGYTVDRYNKVYMVSWTTQTKPYPYTPRDLVKFAKSQSENVIRGGADLKEYQHRGNRAKTRQDIARGCFENFYQNKSRHHENPWNFD